MSAIIVLLLAASPKPVCNAAHHGMYWPAAANGNRQVVRELYRTGELEICMAGEWKYKWTPLSVHVSRLAKKSRQAKRVP